jgi:hypothetical protein
MCLKLRSGIKWSGRWRICMAERILYGRSMADGHISLSLPRRFINIVNLYQPSSSSLSSPSILFFKKRIGNLLYKAFDTGIDCQLFAGTSKLRLRELSKNLTILYSFLSLGLSLWSVHALAKLPETLGIMMLFSGLWMSSMSNRIRQKFQAHSDRYRPCWFGRLHST